MREPRSFLDTNVLVYSQSPDEPRRQRQALELIERLGLAKAGVISLQVQQEFCNVALKKLRMPYDQLRARLSKLERLECVKPSAQLIHTAIDLHERHSISFYDAMIVAAAQAANCALLYSEDLQAGASFGNVRVVNPFADA